MFYIRATKQVTGREGNRQQRRGSRRVLVNLYVVRERRNAMAHCTEELEADISQFFTMYLHMDNTLSRVILEAYHIHEQLLEFE